MRLLADKLHGERKRPTSGWASLTRQSVTSCDSSAKGCPTRTSPHGFSSHHRPCKPTSPTSTPNSASPAAYSSFKKQRATPDRHRQLVSKMSAQVLSAVEVGRAAHGRNSARLEYVHSASKNKRFVCPNSACHKRPIGMRPGGRALRAGRQVPLTGCIRGVANTMALELGWRPLEPFLRSATGTKTYRRPTYDIPSTLKPREC